MTTLELKAPLSGFLMPIEQVPDPVFAAKTLGDGIALDPTSSALLAPCEGHIVHLHEANHALTIATPDGLEILIHVGLDTVALRGEGFLPHVHKGDFVLTGQVLVEFDADYVARYAPSLLTMVVITNSEEVANFGKAAGQAIAGESVIMTLNLNGEAPAVTPVSSPAIPLANQAGLHARPAAVLAGLARKFDARIQLRKGSKSANAKSVVDLMTLNVAFADQVYLEARGAGAQEAVDTLALAIKNGLGEEGTPPLSLPASVARAALSAPPPRPRSAGPNTILGVTASPGLAVGNVHQVRRAKIEIPEQGGGDPQAERAALDKAIAQAILALEAQQARLLDEFEPGKAALFGAQQEFLGDPDLLDMARQAINNGDSAAFAWQAAIDTQAGRLEALSSELLVARASDLRDAGRRVLAHLAGEQNAGIGQVPVNTILIAEDLALSDVASLDRDRVVGFATTLGGATSHVALLARAFDLAAIAGIESRALDLPNGTPLILDATRGRIQLKPRPDEIAAIVGKLRQRKQKRKRDLEVAHNPAITTDGRRVKVLATIGDAAAAEQALALGAEGVGLLRTEFLFIDRQSAPTEEEQAEIYAAIAGTLGGKNPLVIRTLDLGADKTLPYLPLPPERNPFLGERGIRLGLDRPQVFRAQIRAILRASEAGGNIHIMFPMIATLDEWRMARAVVSEEENNLGLDPVPVGIMVEVPAAAMMAEQFAREVEFFSIGTNDLAQYALAMDRGHPRLAPRVDGLNPAVLRLIAQTTAGAGQHGRRVAVCGGMAADPQAVPILLGLGVEELSVPAPSLPAVKAQVRALSFAETQKIAREALALESAAQVRALVPLQDDAL